MYIQEVAKESGISVRTLRYYDEIGLLKPDEISPSGYRIYREQALKRLQRILFYRELDFPLEKIKQLLASGADEEHQMRGQLELLRLKQKRLEGIIKLLEQRLKGEASVSIKEFNMDEIKAHEDKYRAEVEDKYGQSEAYQESQKRTSKYGEKDWQAIKQASDAIYQGLAKRRHQPPESEEVQGLISDWQALITKYFYPCSDEILASLGEMYQADERFRDNIDQYGEGLTDYMSEAIRIYTTK